MINSDPAISNASTVECRSNVRRQVRHQRTCRSAQREGQPPALCDQGRRLAGESGKPPDLTGSDEVAELYLSHKGQSVARKHYLARTPECYRKLAAALELLRSISPDTLDKIRDLRLDTAMRIHTPEFYLPLPSEFVRECGRLGLDICILNVTEADTDEDV